MSSVAKWSSGSGRFVITIYIYLFFNFFIIVIICMNFFKVSSSLNVLLCPIGFFVFVFYLMNIHIYNLFYILRLHIWALFPKINSFVFVFVFVVVFVAEMLMD